MEVEIENFYLELKFFITYRMTQCYTLKLNDKPILEIRSECVEDFPFKPRLHQGWLRLKIAAALRAAFRSSVVNLSERTCYPGIV
jgi:hypothetical protein